MNDLEMRRKRTLLELRVVFADREAYWRHGAGALSIFMIEVLIECVWGGTVGCGRGLAPPPPPPHNDGHSGYAHV